MCARARVLLIRRRGRVLFHRRKRTNILHSLTLSRSDDEWTRKRAFIYHIPFTRSVRESGDGGACSKRARVV